MSAVRPTSEQSTLATSRSSFQPPKPQRVLACVLCQQRKVKCNRKFPCANCIRLGVSCVPATLTPRRRRRRFPERELLDRLRKYEGLLCQNNIKFELLYKDPAGENGSPNAEGTNDSDEEPPPEVVGIQRPYPPATVKSESVYEAKYKLLPCHAMNQGFRDPDNDSDSSHDDVREAMVKSAWDQLYANNGHLLLGTRKTSVDLSALHPDPVQIFRLWQIYLDNVNPLLKVTYTPSLQGRIIEAASTVTSTGAALEALMFSIYCVSIETLAVEDCQATFGSSKEDLLTAYQFGCEQALLNCGFLRSGNRDCLTALFLYLVSVGPSPILGSLSSMLGVAIRIAQRMGIHSESANAKCIALEAEMRRRLWWSLVLFDTRVGELVNYRPAMLAPTWGCKVPLNVNDSDLWLEMKEPLVVQGKSTDAIFTVVRSELSEFVRHAAFYLDFTIPSLKPVAKDGPTLEGGGLATLEKMVDDKYLQFCDPENPLHFMTIWTTRAYLAKCRLIEHYSRCSSVQQTEAQRDAALSHALDMLDCDSKIMTSPLTKGYIWLLHFYFPFPAYIHIVQDLKRRLVGEQAEQAWEVMSAHYEARFALLSTGSLFFELFSTIILQAWEAIEASFQESGQLLTPPRIVSRIRDKIAQISLSRYKADTEQYNAPMGMDMGGFPVSMPMGVGDQSLFYDMGGQDNCIGTGPSVFPNPNLSTLDIDVNQLDWAAMDWSLGALRGW